MRTKILNDEVTRSITVLSLGEFQDLSDAEARRAAETELLRLGQADGWYYDGVTRENCDKVVVHFSQ